MILQEEENGIQLDVDGKGAGRGQFQQDIDADHGSGADALDEFQGVGTRGPRRLVLSQQDDGIVESVLLLLLIRRGFRFPVGVGAEELVVDLQVAAHELHAPVAAIGVVESVEHVDEEVVAGDADDFPPLRMRVVPQAQHHFRQVHRCVPLQSFPVRSILTANYQCNQKVR